MKRGAENEQKVIEELVSPSHLASKIIGELAITQVEAKKEEKKNKGVTIWIIIASIFASPIALPLAFAVVIVLFAVLITVIAVYASLFVSGASIAFSGIVSFASAFSVIGHSLANAIFVFGFGLLLVAVGASICVLMWQLTRLTFVGIKKLLAKFLVRRGSK